MKKETTLEVKTKMHQKQVKKLIKLEGELIELVANTNDDKLMDKFVDWQNQRNSCNSSYVALVNIATKV